MKKLTKLGSILKSGVQFQQVDYLIEIFPSPIPKVISNVEIKTEGDLLRMSSHEGYDELFFPDSDFITGESKGVLLKLSRSDFLRWQLERFSNQTLYHLLNKTDCQITHLMDEDAEYEKDPDYHPEGWLDPSYNEEGYFEKGLNFIERVKKEVTDDFYKSVINSMIDPNCGLLAHLETEINDNLTRVRKLYGKWEVPLMIVSKGKFLPYIQSDFDHNLMMDEYILQRMYVRNYDEGNI